MNIRFLGGANEVGASSTLITIEGQRILVDAGIRMGVEQRSRFPDWDDVGRIDAVLLTHAHSDHTGALPVLARDRLNAGTKVYCTAATRAITKILLNDSARRMERKKKGDKRPEYTVCDVNNAMRRITEVQFGTGVPVCGGALTATWIPAGHILGAAMIYIEVKEQRILMTGDVSAVNQLALPDLIVPPWCRPDLMVMESTYGNRRHENRTQQSIGLAQDVFRTIKDGGKVLIPAFAVGRSQEVILMLKRAMEYEQIPGFHVYVDGMVREINDVYSRFVDDLSPSLECGGNHNDDLFYQGSIMKVDSKDHRDRILSGPPCCIVASSGMLNGGVSSFYAERIVGDPKNLIAIPGYQAEGSPGRALLDLADSDAPTDREWKQEDGTSLRARCRVKSYSLSAHADRDELTWLVKEVQPGKLFLVHGDDGARGALETAIREKLPSVEVELPVNGDSYYVETIRLSGAA